MLKSLYFLLYLLIIPTVFAGKGRTDFSIFIDQEDELFLKAGLIVPDGRSWLKQSLLWGPASLANYVQLIKQKKNRPVVDHEKLVKAVAQASTQMSSSGVNIVKGLTANEFIKFSDIFLRKLVPGTKFKGEYEGTNNGVDTDTLFSDAPSIVILKFSSHGALGQKIFDPNEDNYIFIKENGQMYGHLYFLKVKADKEQRKLWLIDPSNPSDWTIVTLSPSLGVSSTDSFDMGAIDRWAVGSFIKWNLVGNLVPSIH